MDDREGHEVQVSTAGTDWHCGRRRKRGQGWTNSGGRGDSGHQHPGLGKANNTVASGEPSPDSGANGRDVEQ